MSQLVDITITNRGASLDLLPGGPTLYGFDVKDIVSPIRYSSALSKSYFTARTNKGGVNDNHNGSKINYQSSDSLAVIAAKSPLFLLLNVVSRRGVDGNNEAYIFVSSKITESLVPTPDGTLFYYIEDGDPLPVEYIVEQTVPEIIAISGTGFLKIQDNGVDMPPEQKLNFVGYTVEDNPGNNSTDIIAVKPITWAALEVLRAAGDLPLGAQYLITDRGDAGIIVDVSAPNKISLRAKGLFLVPDFQDVGTYTTTPLPKGTNRKVWSLSQQTGVPYVDGDIVFWDGYMFQVIDDTLFDTNNPGNNASAYELLTRNVTNGYILDADAIIYDFVTDGIYERKDKRGNTIGSIGYNFQWGNNLVNRNSSPFGNLVCVNQKGNVTRNTNESPNGITIDETFTNVIEKNYFNGNGVVTFNSTTANIISECVFSNASPITITTNIAYYGKQIDAIHSTFDGYLDMLDGAIYAASVLTIPPALNYVGEFTLVGNTGKTMNKIVNLSTAHRITRFKVEAGLTQNFQHIGIGSAVLDNIVSDSATTNNIVGRADGADFIEYERSGNVNVRTNIVKLA